jgi:hypothetical protein
VGSSNRGWPHRSPAPPHQQASQSAGVESPAPSPGAPAPTAARIHGATARPSVAICSSSSPPQSQLHPPLRTTLGGGGGRGGRRDPRHRRGGGEAALVGRRGGAGGEERRRDITSELALTRRTGQGKGTVGLVVFEGGVRKVKEGKGAGGSRPFSPGTGWLACGILAGGGSRRRERGGRWRRGRRAEHGSLAGRGRSRGAHAEEGSAAGRRQIRRGVRRREVEMWRLGEGACAARRWRRSSRN